METSPATSDDSRILTYARLIDPDVWPEDGEPAMEATASVRIRASLEAASRIALHEGVVSDPSEAVDRICMAIGLAGSMPTLMPPIGMDLAELASLASTLMNGGDEDDAHPIATVPEEPSRAPCIQEDETLEPAGRMDAHEAENEEDDAVVEVDPDHDPEAGISHVGDADEGQYHEELP